MKPKLLLCLALVLSGGLFGCSSMDHSSTVAKAQLKFVKVDSEETDSQDGWGKNAVDGNPHTYWHTQWQGAGPGLPHEIIIELLPPSFIKGFTYLPRQDESDHGTIKDYEFYVSDDGENFGSPVKKGRFETGKREKMITFEPVKCRFIKLKAISEINGLPWTSAAEIGVIQSREDTSIMAAHQISYEAEINSTSKSAVSMLDIFQKIEQHIPELVRSGINTGASSPGEVFKSEEYGSAGFILWVNPGRRAYDLHVTIHRYASPGAAQHDLEESLGMRSVSFDKENHKGATLYKYQGASGGVMTWICQSRQYIIEINSLNQVGNFNEGGIPWTVYVLDVVLAELGS